MVELSFIVTTLSHLRHFKEAIVATKKSTKMSDTTKVVTMSKLSVNAYMK